MKKTLFSVVLGASLVMGVAMAQAADPDPAAGAKVFTICRACHTLEAGKNRIGPSLHGLFGRKSGSVPGFAYSPAMKNAGITWDETTLNKYLKDPKAVVVGNKMAFAGVKNDQDRQNLIAYLKEATK